MNMDKKYIDLFLNQDEFLKFLKSKFKLFHLSNVFYRDLHYGVWEFLDRHGVTLNYGRSEDIAREAITMLEKKSILKRIDDRTWLLNYLEFKLIRVQHIQLKVPTAV